MTATRKIATAARLDGDVYDVHYPGRAGFDRAVGYRYLCGLVRGGYQVTIDQSRHCPAGEPKTRDLNAELAAS
jgi:hypothetical protein